MFTTMDSQPQEWLLHDPNALHTVAFCSFQDGAHARRWIHRLVPLDRNGNFVKWSSGSRRRSKLRRRTEFIDRLEAAVDEVDFSVQCISSRESDISVFAQAFYLQNPEGVSQETDAHGCNHLVFKVDAGKSVKMPVLRAARIIWAFYCLKYMKDSRGLEGFIRSDWFACDTMETADQALGVSLLTCF